MLPSNPKSVYFDLESTRSDGIPLICPAKLKNAIFCTDGTSVSAIVSGDGSEGKTCASHAIGNREDTKYQFPGVVLYIAIGAESSLARLIE